jgi:hypothetical protein
MTTDTNTREATDEASVRALDQAIDTYSRLIKNLVKAEKDWGWVEQYVPEALPLGHVATRIRSDYYQAVLNARQEKNYWAVGHQHLAPLIEAMYKTNGGT